MKQSVYPRYNSPENRKQLNVLRSLFENPKPKKKSKQKQSA